MELPIETFTGYINANGTWQIDFTPNYAAVIVTRIIIMGPVGSSLNVYIGTTLVDATLRGDINSNELLQPVSIAAGNTLSLVWSLGTGNPATATIFTSEKLRG